MSRILYSTLFGSHLFGTARPDSDTDRKHVILPDIEGLLMGKRIANRVENTNQEERIKNGKDDVDVEFVPLQIFARDFMQGQPYALEIAFSIDGTHAEQTHFDEQGLTLQPGASSLFKDFVAKLKNSFLTCGIGKILGMAANQAYVYSAKGSRLAAAQAAVELFASAPAGLRIRDALLLPDFAVQAAKLEDLYPEDFRREMKANGGGKQAESFFLLEEKTVHFTVNLSHGLLVARALSQRYGKRAEEASKKAGDWKANMHAVRVLDEGLDLLTLGRIELPTPSARAHRLLEIREGLYAMDTIRAELDTKILRINELEALSSLPRQTPEFTARFEVWLQDWMLRFYGLTRVSTPVPPSTRRISL